MVFRALSPPGGQHNTGKIHSDCPRRLQGVIAGDGSRPTPSDQGQNRSFVTGGQGVAGSSPAVPTVLERLCGMYKHESTAALRGRPLRHRTERAGPVLRPGGRQARPLKDHDVGLRGVHPRRGQKSLRKLRDQADAPEVLRDGPEHSSWKTEVKTRHDQGALRSIPRDYSSSAN